MKTSLCRNSLYMCDRQLLLKKKMTRFAGRMTNNFTESRVILSDYHSCNVLIHKCNSPVFT